MPANRKRASKACVLCHERKVRCDASILGHPCTRCRHDNQECIIGGRYTPKARAIPTQAREPRRMSICATSIQPSLESHWTVPGCDAQKKNHVAFSSYSFLKWDGVSRMTPEDLAFLNSRGCLQLPAQDLLEEFVRQYFLHCQLNAPIIDEALFWKVYQNPQVDGTPKIPLLVFQAMIFASSPFVSLQTVQHCGFEDGKAAWNTLYERAKVLFHLASDDGPLARAQTALLLTFFTSAEEPQVASTWLTHAIQAATSAHSQTSDEVRDRDVRRKLLQDRLWWSILLRDRSLCLVLRRRPQVLSLEMTMMNDLPREADFETEIHGSQVYDAHTKRMAFTVFQEQCQLAALLTKMVSLIFGRHGLSHSILTRESFEDTLSLVNKIKNALILWKNSSCVSTFVNECAHNAVIQLAQLTMMHYHTARMDLAHYEAFLIENHVDFVQVNYIEQLAHTGNMLLDAATQMISIMQYFSEKRKFQNLPLTLLGYVVMPLVLSAINFKLSSSESQMFARRQTLECLSKIMGRSRRMYDVGDFVSSQTDDILYLAYLASKEIFLKTSHNTQNWRRGSSICPNSSLNGTHGNETQMTKGPATSWHDAFLRYPRAYLLISTTVDHFMSVGRLPHDSSLPDLVCSMAPLGRIRLPWTSKMAIIGKKDDLEKAVKMNKKQEAELSKFSSPRRYCEPEKEIWSSKRTKTSPRNSQESLHEGIDLTSGERLRVNLDYMPLSQAANKPLFVSPADDTRIESSQLGSEPVSNLYIKEAEQWQIAAADIATSYDAFVSSLVQECFGPVPCL